MKNASCTVICIDTTSTAIDGRRYRTRKDRIRGRDIRRWRTGGTCTCSGESLRRRIKSGFYTIATAGDLIWRVTFGRQCRRREGQARGRGIGWRFGGRRRSYSAGFTTLDARFGITTTRGSTISRRASGSVGARGARERSDRVRAARVTWACTMTRSSCTEGIVKTLTTTATPTRIVANAGRRFQTLGS